MNLTNIRLNPNNPRFIKDDKFKKLCTSIKDFPAMLELRPIIVDETGLILGGNMRFRALQELKMDLKPEWIKIGSLTEEEKRKFIVEDNIGFGEWDWDLLANEYGKEELEEWGLDVDKWTEDGVVEEDEVPDINDYEVESSPGEVYQLGKHRLMCGDSTSIDDVNKLTGGKQLILMATDPPYGVNLDQSWRDKALGDKAMGPGNKNIVTSDDRADWYDAWVIAPVTVAYVWHASSFTRVVADSLERAGFDICQQLIWNKSIMVMGRSDYHFKHEPCWYAIKKGSNHNWQGDRTQTTVWDEASPNHIMSGSTEDKTDHPTQKPVGLFVRSIRNNTARGDGVYDPFLGSGSTLIACEQTDRVCYGMDIDPKYCDIVRKRYAKFIGKEEEWIKITPRV